MVVGRVGATDKETTGSRVAKLISDGAKDIDIYTNPIVLIGYTPARKLAIEVARPFLV